MARLSPAFPFMLPHQICTADGSLTPAAPLLTQTETTQTGNLTCAIAITPAGPSDIDFGDGTPAVHTENGAHTHTYAKAGTYVVTSANGKARKVVSVVVPKAAAQARASKAKDEE